MRSLILAGACALVFGALSTSALADSTVVVTPESPNGWAFAQESGDAGAAGAFAPGPGAPPLGDGSAHFTLSDASQGETLFGAAPAVRLADLTTLTYSTYDTAASAAAQQAVALQFDVDSDTTDGDTSWQGRLVSEPYQSGEGPLVGDAWQQWDALAGTWWATHAPINALCPQSSPCTTAQLEAAYPNVGLRGGSSGLQLKAGSGWSTPFDGAADALSIGYGGSTTTYDFEGPLGPCAATTDSSSKTITLTADCTTDHTLQVPDGWTLDGAGHTITAVDPAGGHFVGAIVTNAGSSANVQNVTITASGLSDVCDGGADRLAGILLHDASGTIAGVSVQGVRQGLSGCQEGDSISASNDDGSPATSVTIADSAVSDYQKNGIRLAGPVAATITGNTVTADGPIDFIAQNGIEVLYGASAFIRGNSVSGDWYSPATVTACGLLFYQAGGVKQQANTLFGNQTNLCNAGRGGGNPAMP